METFQPFELPKRSSHENEFILMSFDRRTLLDVYFARSDDRIPETIPAAMADLYAMDLTAIKEFLLNQKPLDPLLHKLLKTEF